MGNVKNKIIEKHLKDIEQMALYRQEIAENNQELFGDSIHLEIAQDMKKLQKETAYIKSIILNY